MNKRNFPAFFAGFIILAGGWFGLSHFALRNASDIDRTRFDIANSYAGEEMPAAGMPFEDYLKSRFGGRANIQPVLDNLAAEGRAEGIDFNFHLQRRVPNTTAAHQLVYFGEMRGVDQSALAEGLFSAFFEQGLDIGDPEVLVRIARPHGLNRDDVLAALADDKTRQFIQSREAQVRGSGLGNVPGFLVNRRLLVVGAQSTDTLVNAFDQAVFGDGNDALVSPALH